MPNDMAMRPASPVASAEADGKEILNLSPHATAIGLNLPETCSFEEWREIGQKLGRAKRTLQWWIGDWWVHGEHHYGDRIQQVEDFGLSFQTCANYGRVARAFRETSRRRELLSFAHHETVAALKPEDADRLLDWCLEGVAEGKRDRRRVRELRNEIISRRIKTAEDAARDEEVAAVSKKMVFTNVEHPPREIHLIVTPRAPSTPYRFLLTSAPGGLLDNAGNQEPLSPEPAALTVAPPLPHIDHDAIAKAALTRLGFDQARAVVLGWFAELSALEQNSVREAIWGSSERRATSIRRSASGDA
jgi:hypothetical protein